MINPDDWAVILRWPRASTILQVSAVVLAPTVLVVGFVAGLNYFNRRRMPQRALAIVGLAVAVPLIAVSAYVGVNARMRQAACWRLGPDGVTPSEHEVCERMPPRGFESFY